jgi:hypothetical protein
VETILGGLLIALVSGLIGKAIGGYKKVKECDCDRRQKDCQRLLIEKIDHLKEKIEELTVVVNGKVLGL